jgi:hypothetical protein
MMFLQFMGVRINQAAVNMWKAMAILALFIFAPHAAIAGIPSPEKWDAAMIVLQSEAIVVVRLDAKGGRFNTFMTSPRRGPAWVRDYVVIEAVGGELKQGDTIRFFHPPAGMEEYAYLLPDAENLIFIRKMPSEEIDAINKSLPMEEERLPTTQLLWTFTDSIRQWMAWIEFQNTNQTVQVYGRLTLELREHAKVPTDKTAILGYIRRLVFLRDLALYSPEKIKPEDLDEFQRAVVEAAKALKAKSETN